MGVIKINKKDITLHLIDDVIEKNSFHIINKASEFFNNDILDRVLNSYISKKLFKFYFIRFKNITIGLTCVYDNSIDEIQSLWIGWTYIMEEYRNKGVGTTVINILINNITKIGEYNMRKSIRLWTDNRFNVSNFYKKLGFKVLCKGKNLHDGYENKEKLSGGWVMEFIL